MARTKSYTGVLSSAMFQGLSTGSWVAAGGLPPRKRRAVRAAIVAAGVGVAAVQYRLEQQEEPHLLDTPVLVKDVLAREVPTTRPEETGLNGPPQATLVAFWLAVSAGVALGGRQLEKRWLARLIRNGHARPHRSLGIRMGALSTATALASGLGAVVASRRAEREQTEPAG